jgi:hypothetical protein
MVKFVSIVKFENFVNSDKGARNLSPAPSAIADAKSGLWLAISEARAGSAPQNDSTPSLRVNLTHDNVLYQS